MELDDDDPTEGKSSKDVRKNIAIKLKSSGKGRGRPRKASKSTKTPKKKEPAAKEKKEFIEDLDPDEPREEFSTMKVTGEEPMHKAQKLKWDHKVNLIGIKVVDPIIHTCSTCYLPILIYGRMIPCKHVFCFDCAKKTDKVCPRCNDPVNRVEQSALGAVFVCNYGGSKHGVSGCRRTYLSQRDLQAHINYRHLKQEQAAEPQPPPAPASVKQAPPPVLQQAPPPTINTQQAPPIQVAISVPASVPAYGGLPLTSPPIQLPLVTSQPPPQQQPPHDPSLIYHQQPPMQQQQQPPQQQQQAPPPPQHVGPPPRHCGPDTGLSHGTPPLQPSQHPPPVNQIHQPLGPPPLGGGHHPGHILPPPAMSVGVGGQGPPPQLPQTPRMQPPVTSHVDSFHNIPVMSSRTSNLITVPIQDESDFGRREQPPQYPVGSGANQPPPFRHPPPAQNMGPAVGQNMGPVVAQNMAPVVAQNIGPGVAPNMGPPVAQNIGPPPPSQHYNPSSINHNSGPIMNQPPLFSTNTHLPPPQVINTSHPPPMTGPRPINMNMSQPPPNNPLSHTGVPPPPRQGPPPHGPPPLNNRFPGPAPPRSPFDKSNMFGQPPPNNPRPWQGGPPPGPGPMGSGPPPPCNPPNNANNMGPPLQRPFYQ